MRLAALARWAVICSAAVVSCPLGGCDDRAGNSNAQVPVVPGGGSAVTQERLTGARLEYIGDPGLAWEFGPSRVVISSANGPLPAELLSRELPEAGDAAAAPARIELAWRLDGPGLVLSDPRSGGRNNSERRLLIRPAGMVRVDVGERQYNVYPAGSPERRRAASSRPS